MIQELTLGARPTVDGVRFCVWAPDRHAVDLVLESHAPEPRIVPLQRSDDGMFSVLVPGLSAGARYRYRLDGAESYPDPASRFQPDGVHGSSEVIDPARFAWTDASWRGVSADRLVIYELHVGTFSQEGTFAGVARRLPELAELGVTAIELLPVADFPGQRNWGYDGVDLFAPARCYGTPDDLRSLVDEAHRLGLAVLLDVVYNHLGPDGNYLAMFSADYFSKVHRTPWGPAVNLDGPRSEFVRAFFIENALHWLREYHLDGLRLDATHRFFDDSPVHFLAELGQAVHDSIQDRTIHLIAEDMRNLATMVRPAAEGGWGLDGIWSDDFHHELRRYLVGDFEGAFRDFRGVLADLVQTSNRGWLFCGAYSIHRGCLRGTDPSGLAPRQFVFYIQNHDRIGNRALGERLNHQVDGASFRAASALLLTTAATPLLFMGQEWAASTPFVFFTDHNEELGRLVHEGRIREFRDYQAFVDPALRERIPHCQSEQAFLDCKLNWSEREQEPHAATLRLYQALLRLRKNEPALQSSQPGSFEAVLLDEDSLALRREGANDTAPSLWLVTRLKGSGTAALADLPGVRNQRWEVVLTTEDPSFAPAGNPPSVDLEGTAPSIEFFGPAAVLLRAYDESAMAAIQ